jgi:hypothetical protein
MVMAYNTGFPLSIGINSSDRSLAAGTDPTLPRPPVSTSSTHAPVFTPDIIIGPMTLTPINAAGMTLSFTTTIVQAAPLYRDDVPLAMWRLWFFAIDSSGTPPTYEDSGFGDPYAIPLLNGLNTWTFERLVDGVWFGTEAGPFDVYATIPNPCVYRVVIVGDHDRLAVSDPMSLFYA